MRRCGLKRIASATAAIFAQLASQHIHDYQVTFGLSNGCSDPNAMPATLRRHDDMNSSGDECGEFSSEKRVNRCPGQNFEMIKRSCASLLPSASVHSPADYAPALLVLPGCHDCSLNQSRLNKCVVLGLTPQLLQWLAIEFGSELLCHTLVRTAPTPSCAAALTRPTRVPTTGCAGRLCGVCRRVHALMLLHR